MFTLLKALTALKLADQVARDHGVPAVAIFWIDAEDHDWEEVRSCTVFDGQLEPQSVSLPARPGAEPAPVATVRLDEAILDVLSASNNFFPTQISARPSWTGCVRRTHQDAAWPTHSADGWRPYSAIAA